MSNSIGLSGDNGELISLEVDTVTFIDVDMVRSVAISSVSMVCESDLVRLCVRLCVLRGVCTTIFGRSKVLLFEPRLALLRLLDLMLFRMQSRPLLVTLSHSFKYSRNRIMKSVRYLKASLISCLVTIPFMECRERIGRASSTDFKRYL